MARGVVFNDLNANGILDSDEPRLEGIKVSNGRKLSRRHQTGLMSYPFPVMRSSL